MNFDGNHALESDRRRAQFANFFRIVGMIGLCGIPLLHITTGGFLIEKFGLKLSFFSVTNPVLLSLVMIVLWLWLDRDSLKRFLDFTSDAARFDYFIIAGSTLYIFILKLWQYHTFQTSAYDTGMHVNIAWNTAFGDPYYSGIQGFNYLGDHFSPFYGFIAPLFRLFPSAILLIGLQTLGFGIAAIALVKVAKKQINRPWFSFVLLVAFFTNAYVTSVSEFDLHPAAFAIPIFAWILWAMDNDRHSILLLLSLLALTIEESLIPPLIGILFFAAVTRPKLRWLACILIIVASSWLFLILTHWMPLFLGGEALTHIHQYEHLGGRSLGAIVKNLLTHPWLFLTTLGSPPKKLFKMGGLFLSVGFLPLLSGRRLWLLFIPIYTISMSQVYFMWNYGYHYAAFPLAMLFYCSIYGFKNAELIWLKNREKSEANLKLILTIFILVLAWNTKFSPTYVKKWFRNHIRIGHELIQSIPPSASICASHNYVAHLAIRSHIKVAPYLGSEEFVLLDDDLRSAFPYDYKGLKGFIQKMLSRDDYELIDKRDGFLLFKRKKS